MSGEEVYCICRTSKVNRFMIGCDHCEEWYHGDCVNVTEKAAKYIKKYYCKACRDKNSKLSIVYKKSKDEHHDRHKHRHEDRKHHHHHHRHDEDKEHRHKKHKDKKHKDRDKDKKTKEEMKETKVKGSKEEEEEEGVKKRSPPRPRPISPTSSSSSSTSSPLPQPQSSNPPAVPITNTTKSSSKPHFPPPPPPPPPPPTPLPLPPPPPLPPSSSSTSSGIHSKAVLKDRSNYNSETDEDDDDLWVPATKSEKKIAKEKPKTNKRTKASTTIGNANKKRRLNGSESEDERTVLDMTPRQCQANCVNTARIESKYCSDQCGINMASMRIYQTLPDRIREWNLTPCLAEKNNRKELESIRQQQDAVKKRLEQLGIEFQELEELIERGKSLSIVEKDDDDDDEIVEMTVHCVTCGQSVTAATATRHMERCYNRMESQTSFASKFKTQIYDDRMFCDYYNSKEQSYCKRLQVLCPEHNRDPVPGDNEVCGSPLEEDKLFESKKKTTTEFCRLAKKRCQQHFSWEKLRRAVIDMERVRQWMKVDELFEQERQIRAAMSSRAGVLGLMLHSTYNHELEERWQAQRAAAVAAAQQRKLQKK